MTAAAPSAVLATIRPAFTGAGRLALAGFLAGYRGLAREACALDLRQFNTWCRACCPGLVRRSPGRHRRLRRRAGSAGPCPRGRRPAAVRHRRVLQVRGRRGAPGALTRRACPPPAGGLRIACGRAGPQRARRAAGDGRARPVGRACADLAAGPEQAAGSRGRRRRHRAPRPRARAPGADDHTQGRHGPSRSRWRRAPPGQPARPPASAPAGRSFWPRTADGWTGTAPDGSSARPRAEPGSPRPSRLIRSGTRSSPRRWMPGSRCATCTRPPRTPTRAPRSGMTGPAAAWTGLPLMWSLPASPEPPGSGHRLEQLCPAAARHWPPDSALVASDPAGTCRRPAVIPQQT
jgi:hypothetical protein